jgi:hypothetical protein
MEGRHCIQAISRDAASGLSYKIKFDVHKYPFLCWSWKVANVLEKEDVSTKEGDDFAARVYVAFPSWIFWQSKVLSYVWAGKMSKGQAAPSPFSNNGRIIAVESGPQNVGKWHTECRNMYEDFRHFFGEEPPMAGGVAIMTDTDNTGGSATAWYGPITINQKECQGKTDQ